MAASVAVFACVAAGWQLAAQHVPEGYLPTPAAVMRAGRGMWLSGPWYHLYLTSAVGAELGPSVTRLLLGWALAGVAGTMAGAIVAASPVLAQYIEPVTAFMRAIPATMLISVWVLVFGAGAPAEVASIAWGGFWPVLVSSIDGVRQADPMYLETARAFGVSKWRSVIRVRLPAAVPRILPGLRTALSLSITLMVVAELIDGSTGIGYQLLTDQADSRYPEMGAAVVLLAILGWLLNSILASAERHVFDRYGTDI